ncbi:MFS transporter [Siphonobacter sp. BAB-5385]|uniref:MFS transporter n=1 Tax=Siphonobacter sp. BAB-5385 TaxID=1864822 RepID=UPI000B9E6DFE|nr:MFS transporter [Siphonobacter sp. BAB-5385]OZI09145.1 MFS transporter [Siphonobacter sp. BAB-5385]
MVNTSSLVPQPSRQSLSALDKANFLLADVRDGMGPYLAIYLMVTLRWQPQDIGIAMSVMGITTVVMQTPAGILVDRTTRKKLFTVLASLLMAGAALLTITIPTYPVIMAGQALMGISAAWFGPAVAAITLGLVGHQALDARIGRNETFNHAGNVIAALLAGLIGHFLSSKGIFVLLAVMSLLSSISIWQIKDGEINHELARGSGESDHKTDESSWRSLLRTPSLLLFALACVLFHFANAAMLPLLGQRLSLKAQAGEASVYMSACIVVAQIVMIPVSAWVGKHASKGRKRILLVAFLVLPIRGVLYTLTNDEILLVCIQVLDGLGAGIFGVLSILIVSDLTKGTGLFNTTQGAIATAVGLGASLSNAFAGFLLQRSNFQTVFLVLAGIALVALLLVWCGVPETKAADESIQ